MPYNLFLNCALVKLRQASIPKSRGSDNPRAKSCFQSRVAFPANILDTFPIVRRRDKAAFGHYRTKAMVLAAGDTDVDGAV